MIDSSVYTCKLNNLFRQRRRMPAAICAANEIRNHQSACTAQVHFASFLLIERIGIVMTNTMSKYCAHIYYLIYARFQCFNKCLLFLFSLSLVKLSFNSFHWIHTIQFNMIQCNTM